MIVEGGGDNMCRLEKVTVEGGLKTRWGRGVEESRLDRRTYTKEGLGEVVGYINGEEVWYREEQRSCFAVALVGRQR